MQRIIEEVDVDEIIKDATKRVNRDSWTKAGTALIYTDVVGGHRGALYGNACRTLYKTDAYATRAEAVYAAIEWCDTRMIRITDWKFRS